MTLLVADEPLANAQQYLAHSADAIARSNSPLVGLPVREYSYPTPKLLGSFTFVGTPGLVCLNVVAKDIGYTTAPVGLWESISVLSK